MRRLTIGALAALELLLFVAIVKTALLALPQYGTNLASRTIEFTVPDRRVALRVCFFCGRSSIDGAPLGRTKRLLLIPSSARDSG